MVEITRQQRLVVAATLKLHEQYVYQVLTRRRAVPVDRCHEFERALAGRVICEQLRPDVVWRRVPDPNWPWHPEGRPLIDVARQADTTTQEVERAA